MAFWNGFVTAISHVDPLHWWLAAVLVGGLVSGVLSGYFKARKIQPNGFKWKFFRREIVWAAITLAVTGVVLGAFLKWLQQAGVIRFNHAPAPPWVIAGEFALYFIGFDTWFYWLHRLMHKEPFYKWIHKIHHGSLSPNPLTTFSESPLEGFVNYGFVPVYTALLTIHDQTMGLILPFTLFMGVYVHTGFEFLPRWWNKSWLTKWFISATFHDQHHRYFKGNYGGYTTVWDRLCGTLRPTFEADFEKVASRPIQRVKLPLAKAPAKG